MEVPVWKTKRNDLFLPHGADWCQNTLPQSSSSEALVYRTNLNRRVTVELSWIQHLQERQQSQPTALIRKYVMEQDRQCTYNVTLLCVRVTMVAVGTQQCILCCCQCQQYQIFVLHNNALMANSFHWKHCKFYAQIILQLICTFLTRYI